MIDKRIFLLEKMLRLWRIIENYRELYIVYYGGKS